MSAHCVLSTDELVSKLAGELNLPKAVVRRLLKELAGVAIREYKKTGLFVLPRIGRLFGSKQKARSGRNPQTGDVIKVPMPTVAKFHVDEDFRRRVEQVLAKSVSNTRLPGSPKAISRDVEHPSRKVEEEAAPPTAAKAEKPKYEVVRIFYATDREVKRGKRIEFTSRRSDPGGLTLGTCDVSIPRDHRVGDIERPSILRLEFRENPEKHFVIQSVTAQTGDGFYGELSACVAKSDKKEAFVFIHGFKVAFDEAVYRTAQISHDLQFKGAPILYSWPSNGKIYDYTPDINNADWTVDHLEVFLKDLVAKSDARVIHLIAHSMGNRALTNALDRLSATFAAGTPKFNQIVLTAPDVDADIFRGLAGRIRALGRKITLYASKHDLALVASKKKNGSYPRAGDCSKKVVVLPGIIDTVDASAVDTNFIGHFYYAENRSVLSDIYNLFDAGKDPDGRFGIRAVDATPPYWRFAP